MQAGERLWIKDPVAIVAKGAERGLVIEGGTISELVPAGRHPSGPVSAIFEAGQHVVLPGLVCAHHHFFQSLTRAHPDAAGKPLLSWLAALYPLWSRLTPETLRAAVRISAAELLLSGCTTAADHHYIFPKGLEKGLDVEVEALRDLGLRLTVLRGSVDVSRKEGGLAPDEIAQDRGTILADSERALTLFHDPKAGSMVQVGLAPSSLVAATRELLAGTAALAARYDAPLHMHLLEPPGERAAIVSRFGCEPLDVLEDAGWFEGRGWFAHGIHLKTEEAARLGRHGFGICHCAASNMALGSGHAATVDWRQAGIGVGIGVDGAASSGTGNMMESVRQAFLLGRLRSGPAALGPREVLAWATQGSAACLGRTDIGRLVPGFCADLALFKLDEPRFAGAHDPIDALVLCGASRADRVLVGGIWRVADGQLTGASLPELMADHARAARLFR